MKARRSQQILKNGANRRGNFACEKEGTPHHTEWFRLSKERTCIYRTKATEYSYFIIHELLHCN